jgi:hypothetical protein
MNNGEEERRRSAIAKEMTARRMAYTATGLVVGVTVLWAFVFVPQLAVHPQAIADGVDSSSRMFLTIQLIAAAILMVFVVISWLSGRMFRGLLYLAVVPILIHNIMAFNGAIFYLQTYQGFRALSIMMLVCVAANLIAVILAIMAGEKQRRPS